MLTVASRLERIVDGVDDLRLAMIHPSASQKLNGAVGGWDM